MANGRNPSKKRDTGGDPGGFVALPWAVLDSDAFKDCSPVAKALLMEVARQYHRDDNGRMLLSRVYLATRGWLSADAIQKAKAELIDAGLIFQTVKGHRPNKASWYAVTWRMLDRIAGYDAGVEKAFARGAYLVTPPKKKRLPPTAPANAKRNKNTVLIPVTGTGSVRIAPVRGTRKLATVPAPGTIRPIFTPVSVPVPGNPLDVAISGVDVGGWVALDVALGELTAGERNCCSGGITEASAAIPAIAAPPAYPNRVQVNRRNT